MRRNMILARLRRIENALRVPYDDFQYLIPDIDDEDKSLENAIDTAVQETDWLISELEEWGDN
tara:strand:- start:262 stop:450 length:189 start_codon:yes stop_codon:yes gene_type:complete